MAYRRQPPRRTRLRLASRLGGLACGSLFHRGGLPGTRPLTLAHGPWVQGDGRGPSVHGSHVSRTLGGCQGPLDARPRLARRSGLRSADSLAINSQATISS